MWNDKLKATSAVLDIHSIGMLSSLCDEDSAVQADAVDASAKCY